MNNRKKSVAVLAALGAFGAMTASAATLGGLNSDSLGADQTVVASCDTNGIKLAYTNAFDLATFAYKTNAVVVSSVNPACSGKNFRLTLSSATVSLGESSGVVPATGGVAGTPDTGTFTVAFAPTVDSKSVTQAALVITG